METECGEERAPRMCLHHQRGTFGDGVNDGERRLRRDEEREKRGGLMGRWEQRCKEREMKKVQ